MKLLPMALGATAALKGDDESASDGEGGIVGAWNSVHTLPFPPGSFRELLSFSIGGVVHETNSFLNNVSNLDFSMYGLPSSISGADGVGSWTSSHVKRARVVFRKLLFDGSRQNFGDLLVNGTLRISQDQLAAEWHIQVVDAANAVLADLGSATSQGVRIS